ncbi:MAG: hypothetical protein E7647_00700 [Ruminococcaceae bacterium]|nr:hypothetical protein [Oscillospiraceae bacterium]
MIALYIILGLVLIIGLLLSISVGIGYKYKNGVFTLYVTVGPVKIKLLPKKRKRFNYKKLAKRLRGRRISDIRFTAKEKQKGGELDLKALFSDLRLDKMIDEISRSTKNPELVKILLLTIKEFVLKFRTKLHTTVRHLIIKVDEKDAADTCIRVGVLSQAAAYLLEFLNIFTNMKPQKPDTVAIVPCFDNSGYDFYIDGGFRITVGSLATTFISAAFKSMTAASKENINIQIRKDKKQ